MRQTRSLGSRASKRGEIPGSDGYRSLDEGARVNYESEEGPKGPVATNVSELSG